MVRVPSFSRRPVASGTFSAPQATPVSDATGAQLQQLGSAVQQAGTTAFRIGDQLQDEHNDATVRAFLSNLAEQYRGLLDGENGYRTQRGKGAVDNRERVLQERETIRRRLETGLQNDEQRQMFASVADLRDLNAIDAIERHHATQSRAYNIGETEASREAFVADYATYAEPGNAAAAAQYKQLALQETRDLAQLRGLDTEQAKAAELKVTTRMHVGALDRLVEEGRTDEARSYLSDWGSEIDPASRRRAQSVVQRANVADKAQNLVVENQNRGSIVQQIDRIDRLHQDGRISIEVHDEALARLRRRAREREGQEATIANDALTRALEMTADGPLTAQASQALDDTGMRPAYEAWLRNGGQWRTTEIGHAAMSRLSDAELRKFPDEATVVREFRPLLDDAALNVVRSRWMQTQGKAGPEEAWAIDRDVLTRRLFRRIPGYESFEGLSSKSTSKERRDYEEWQYALQGRVNRNVQGRKATAKDINEAADELLKERLSDGSLLALALPEDIEEGARFQTGVIDPTDPRDDGTLRIDEVSPERRNQAAAALAQANIPNPTEAQLLRTVKLQIVKENAANTAERAETKDYARFVAEARYRLYLTDPSVPPEQAQAAAQAAVINDLGEMLEMAGWSRDEIEGMFVEPRTRTSRSELPSGLTTVGR